MSTPSEPQDRPPPEAGPDDGPRDGPTAAGVPGSRDEGAPTPEQPTAEQTAPVPDAPPEYPRPAQSGPPPGWNVPYNSSGPSTGHYPQYPQNPYGPRAGGWYGAPQQPYPQSQPYAAPQHAPPQQAGYGGPDVSGGWAPSPAGMVAEPEAPRRPGSVALGMVLMILAALPFLILGVAGTTVPLTRDMFPPELGLDGLLAQSALTFEQLVAAVRVLLAFIALLALAYIVLAVVAFTGRNWARVTATVLTAVFSVVMLLNLPGVLGDPSALAVVLAPAVLGIAGVLLMRTPPASAWFASRRARARR
ncbi:hypothetical protein [Pseudonocardia sp.]|uniref:hypothetical protein n=1 Tax=Pseudonocardia sp. TaxID=60912 RepID=UPI0031FCC1B0